MAKCVDGHDTQAEDFCDKCGMPVKEVEEVVAPAPAPEPRVLTCPHCSAIQTPNALFCEACGYDFTTGAKPTMDVRAALGLPAEIVEEAVEETAESASSEPLKPSIPAPVPAKPVPWVAEVWVDPQWYAFQESTDPLPPQGPPRIVALKDSALIGRPSASRNIHPDIDCEPDIGCSRRQAYLTGSDGHWTLNDLDSANGTYVGLATEPLPEEPISGRTLITPDTRIYVGAWTRIVIRPAIESEE